MNRIIFNGKDERMIQDPLKFKLHRKISVNIKAEWRFELMRLPVIALKWGKLQHLNLQVHTESKATLFTGYFRLTLIPNCMPTHLRGKMNPLFIPSSSKQIKQITCCRVSLFSTLGELKISHPSRPVQPGLSRIPEYWWRQFSQEWIVKLAC